MSKESDQALSAVADLIKSTLDSNAKDRFATAARLCKAAHALVASTATKAEDFDDEREEDELAERLGGANPIRVLGRRRMLRNPVMNEADVVREAVGTVLPMLEQQYSSTEERNEADTIDALLRIRENLGEGHVDIVNERIQRLIAKIEERNKNDAVVPAVILRGHSVGERGERVSPDPRAANAAGAGSGEGTQEGSLEEARGAVGERG